MQQNPILAVLKLIVLSVFTVVLIMKFIQVSWLEEKVVKVGKKVETLGSNIADMGRKMDKLAESGVRVARADDGGENIPEERGTATTCNGVKVYARNKGWTVVCDVSANEDPAAAIPEDQVDWDATLNGALTGEPPGLNTYTKDGNVTVESIFYYACDMLAQRKQGDLTQYKAMLAERIEESPDRTQYMIYLRKGIPWHQPAIDLDEFPWLRKQYFVTAKDVKFTYDIIRNPDAGSPDKIQFEDIESVDIIDDYTVKVTWNKPRFYSRPATLDVWPLPSHIWGSDPDGKPYDEANVAAAFNNHWFSKNLCGNGPYRFIEYKPGQYIKYERFEQYYGQRATCKEFVRHIIPSEQGRLAKFFEGGLVSNGLRASQYREYILEGDQDVTFHKYEDFNRPAPKSWKYTYFIYTQPVYSGFAWNIRRPKMQDRNLRMALTLALNRFAIPEKMLYGLGKPIAVGESVLSKYYNPRLSPPPFDPEKAKKLLDKAGWKDTDGDGIRDKVVSGERIPLEIDLTLSANSAMQKQIAQMYKKDLLDIGVHLQANLVDSALWSSRRNDRDFDGIIIFWYAGFDSDPKQLWHSTKANEPNSSNLCGYANPSADKIFEDLEQIFDYPTRIERMHEWYEIQFNDQPYTWMNAFQGAVALNADWRIPKDRLTPRPYFDARLIWKWKNRP